MLGTPDFIAPEQIGDALAEDDIRADIYNLGCTLYYLADRWPAPSKRRACAGSLQAHCSMDAMPAESGLARRL